MNLSARRGIDLLMITLVAIGLVAIGYFANPAIKNIQKRPVKTVGTAYVEMIAKGDVSKAYSEASANVHKAQTEAVFAANLKGTATNTLKVTATSATLGANNTAVFTETVDGLPKSSTGSTKAAFVLAMVKQGGTWKIDSINIY